MKCINKAYGKKGKGPLLMFLLAVAAGSVVLMDPLQDEEIHSYAEPVNAVVVQEHHTDAPKLIKYEVPEGKTSFKSYMSWKAITNTRSKQYKLQEDCWTDSYGLRRYNEDYVIALGSYYSSNIGDRFKITLDTGKSFNAVVGDFKANKHTDPLNQYTTTENSGKCVVEFIVETGRLDSTAKRMGDISYISNFKGNVEKIEKWDQ